MTLTVHRSERWRRWRACSERRSRSTRSKASARCAVVVGLVAAVSASAPEGASATPGTKVWATRYDAPGVSSESATDVGVSPDGSAVFVTGRGQTTDGSFDYATVAYDAVTGAELWSAGYDGLGHAYDIANALAVSTDGSVVFVTGESAGGTTGTDYATVAYDASSGDQLWAARYDGPLGGSDSARAIAVSPNGSAVFVTGGNLGSHRWDDYATVAYDPFTGAQLWVTRYDGPEQESDAAAALAVSPDGSTVLVTGSSTGSTHSDYGTVAYDASTGSRLWARHYSGRGKDVATALAVDPDGEAVFVTGMSVGHTRRGDLVTVAYDRRTGAMLWVHRYDRTRGDVGTAISVGPDGSTVFVTGPSGRPRGNRDYATLAYDAATGAKLWGSRYEGNHGDVPTSLGLSPDGTMVFVTGVTFRSSTVSDYCTVAYDAATGSELWVRRHNGTADGNDYATSLAVDPTGTAIYVTGVSVGASTGQDFGTLAYGVLALGAAG